MSGNNDLKDLTKPGLVGFYKSCSITSIICIYKDNGKNRFKNIFTLCSFEETEFTNYRYWYHTPKPLKINKDFKLSIVTQRVTLEDAFFLYESLLSKGTWKQPDCPELEISNLKPIPRQFVPQTERVPLQSILKNPHRYCSYLFEFFSEEKPFYKILHPEINSGTITQCEKRIYQLLQDYIPIDLEYISDRWENIIFQLPVNLLKVDLKGDNSERYLNVNLRWHPNLKDNSPAVNVYCFSERDQVLVGNGLVEGENTEFKVDVASTDGHITTQVLRRDNSLVLYQKTFTLMKKINISSSIYSGESVEIKVPSRENNGTPIASYKVKPISTSEKLYKDRKDWIWWSSNRSNIESKRQLERRLEFVQYGVNGINQQQKALEDIRKLITQHSHFGAYLWDPYADGIDIIATLFACPFQNVPLRAITSYDRNVKKIACTRGQYIKSLDNWVCEIQSQLEKGREQREINLEVRCQHSTYGWKFHDRFLLFPGPVPKVWSLGTSVNAIGNSHSILHRVEHAQPVMDAFYDLWENLEDCVVWP